MHVTPHPTGQQVSVWNVVILGRGPKQLGGSSVVFIIPRWFNSWPFFIPGSLLCGIQGRYKLPRPMDGVGMDGLNLQDYLKNWQGTSGTEE